MAGIAVPLPPMNSAQIPLPTLPNVPASLGDITNGAKLLDDLLANKRVFPPRATNDDLSHARSLVPINEKLDELNGKIDRLLRMSAQAFNSGCGSGKRRNYQVIPFLDVDGDEDPAAYDLPPLRTIDDINALNQEDLHMYMDRYVIPRSRNIDREVKLRRLRAFLGCSVDQ